MRSTGINAASNSATRSIAADEEDDHKRASERRDDECETVPEPAVQEESRLADRVERVAVLEDGDPRANACTRWSVTSHGTAIRRAGIPSTTAPSGPSA